MGDHDRGRLTARQRLTTLFALLMLIGTSTFLIGGGAAKATTGLAGSPFDGTNGSLDPAAATVLDAVPDDGYKQGAKENDVCPVTAQHNNPPKANILSYSTAVDHSGNDVFLYLAWTRASNNGTTAIEFELNQGSVSCGNAVNKNRTVGDILFSFNFHAGNIEAIEQRLWDGSQWGDPTTPSNTDSESSVSADQLFGEAVFNLTSLKDFTRAGCTTFASAFPKSRASSASFGNEMKDYVNSSPLGASNCGSVSMHKTDDKGNDLAGAVFGLYTDSQHTNLASVTGDNPCTTDANGACSWTDVPPGTYYLYEVSAPANGNYYLANPRSQPVTVQALEDSAPNSTFVNNRKTGSVRIEKKLVDQDKKEVAPGPNGLDGAAFTLLNASDSSQAKLWSNGLNASCTIVGGADHCDIGPVATGDYIVHETAAPPGTGMTAEDTAVTISANQACVEFVQLCQPVVRMTNLAVGTPGLLVEKSGPAQAHEGDKVTYSFKVTNTGNVTLTGISVDDNVLQHIGDIASLLPKATQTLTKDYTIPAGSTANIHNTVTACGTDALQTQTCDTDEHTLDPIHPAIAIDKTVSNAKPHVGDTVTFSYKVTNTGDVTLHDVVVTDDVLQAIGTIPVLKVGPSEAVTLSKTELISGTTPVDNVGTATGKDPLDKVVTASDKQTIEVVAGLVITKGGVTPALAATGASITLELQWAAGLMVLGIFLTVASKRRLKGHRIK